MATRRSSILRNYKFRIVFHNTGEIAESGLRYHYPSTALIGAKSYLRKLLWDRDRKLDEKVTVKALDSKDTSAKTLQVSTIGKLIRA